MSSTRLFLLVTTFLFACNAKKETSEIIIEGQVKNIPDGKLYLTEAHRWQIPLDSTNCINGHFVFKIKPDSDFVPYMAAIHFGYNTQRTKVDGIFFRNHMLVADSAKHRFDGFYLEKGYTRIEGDNEKPPFVRVFAGRETDLMYKNEGTGFGWLGNLDSTKRDGRINFFKKEIRKYPFSFYLLQNLYNAKEKYAEKELNEIFSLFDKNVQASKLGSQFKTYFANRPDPGTPYPNLLLTNADDQKRFILDSTAKLNMLVFWTSWCGPCRLEIPTLKDLQKEYKGKPLNLVSISIDENKEAWVQALKQENMAWPQFVVDSDRLELVKQQFNFSAIPLIVFTDNNGKEIEKFIGYEKEGKKQYDAIIQKFIQ